MNKRQERYKAIKILENEIQCQIRIKMGKMFDEISQSLKDNQTWKSESDRMRRKIYRKTLSNYWSN